MWRFVLVCALYVMHLQSVQAQPVANAHTDRAVVFDIDGTLTPNVFAIWLARHNAAASVQRYADAGFEIIYLSARVRMFQAGVDDWLTENGFPQGHLHLAVTDAAQDAPAQFKADVLNAYRARGWTIAAAYGDSTTDFEAYARAGIPADHVFALRRAFHGSCKTGDWQGCYATWVDLQPMINGIIATAGQ